MRVYDWGHVRLDGKDFVRVYDWGPVRLEEGKDHTDFIATFSSVRYETCEI